MCPITKKTKSMSFLTVAGMLAAGSVLAEKPSWVGGDRAERQEQKEMRKDERRRQPDHDGMAPHRRSDDGARVAIHFDTRHRVAIRDYYADQFRAGHCPPGLAKKRNGCMPPGQARKWRRGHSLPPDVIYYDLPPAVVVHLGPPPAGHRYVRVATDILLIAIGTSMVVDAIEDLGAD
jgi:Ni/Co efflux regulator RcnB